MTSARLALKDALCSSKQDKTPPVADGTLTVTTDLWENNKSVLDEICSDSTGSAGFLEDEAGKSPNSLYAKVTWRIENFSEISKRELRSHQFEVGEYKWYMLVYPQGCDVCNHLSLFLCVADYDKLLPGWSHFAQFTIAVVNKDPKKSKYSDTLHRFCKKEHDWGWKKFMELSKVLDGFTVADTLVIKAQVQVILDRPNRPFRCLDAQYRRELVRVYLTNVESICRRFCEEQRTRLAWLQCEGTAFRDWWQGLSRERQRGLTQASAEAILKGLVKQFFNEKEVTSTLVMDALFCGCKQLCQFGRDLDLVPDGSAAPCVVLNSKTCTFSFALDAVDVVAQLSQDLIQSSKDDKSLALGADGLWLRSGCDDLSHLRRDALERDEKRLAELGQRTVEMYALAHIFTEVIERAYRDYEAELRMYDLIAEEEAAGRLRQQLTAARAEADRDRKAKKRQRKRAKKEAERVKRAAETTDQAQQNTEAVLQQLQECEQFGSVPLAGVRKHSAVALRNLRGRITGGLTIQQEQHQAQQPCDGDGGSWMLHSSSTGSAADSECSGEASSEDGSSLQGLAPAKLQQQQRQAPGSRSASIHGAGGYGAMHNLHHLRAVSDNSSGDVYGRAAVCSHNSDSSSTGSLPTGYAAAVAGMKPPPPAEVTAAALAMAKQHRRMRDLEEQLVTLQQQVATLQAAVNHRDALLAHKDQQAADMRQQLAEQAQELQQYHRLAAEGVRSAAGVGSSSIPSCGAAEVRSFAAVAAGLTAGSSIRSRCSSRSRGASVDMADAAAVYVPACAALSTATSTPVACRGAGLGPAASVGVEGSCSCEVQQKRAAAAVVAEREHLHSRSSRNSSSSDTMLEVDADGMGSRQTTTPTERLASSSGSRSSTASDSSNAMDDAGNGLVLLHDPGPGCMDEPVSPREFVSSLSGGAAAPGPSSATPGTNSRALDSSTTSSTSTSSNGALNATVARQTSSRASREGGSTPSSRCITSLGNRISSSLASCTLASSSLPDGLSRLSLKASSAVDTSSRLAGVLHSSTPLQSCSSIGQLMPPVHRAAGGLPDIHADTAATGQGPATSACIAGALHTGVPNMADGPSPSGSSEGSRDRLSHTAQQQRHTFSAFKSEIAAGPHAVFCPIAAAKACSADNMASQLVMMEDAGLEGFIHMNMIDDLLTE